MSENGQGSSAQKRFREHGNSGAAEYKVWKRWARAALVGKKVGGMLPDALGPWIYTLVDGQAALALDSTDIKDMWTEGGEELVFRELDQRFPDTVAADRMREAMEEAFGLKIMKNETTEAVTGQSILAFSRLPTEGLNLPTEARSYIVLRGCRLRSLRRATIMPAPAGLGFDDVCMAIWTSFLGCPPDWWSHGTFGVDVLEDRIEDGTNDNIEFGDDAEFESEIVAIVGALERIEESDGTEVLATWKHIRTAMAQGKLNWGLRQPHANTRTIRRSPKTLRNQISQGWRVALGATIAEKLVMSTEIKIVQRNASKHREMTLACELCHAIWSCRRLPTSSQPTNHIWRN